ncbi:MAG TPA: SufD family Fe-S cluster assembly protein, partial [Gaiellaceae bacterium]|nr:SufD family Fe-S cluster assembly protein [Gaiellaceae bacterium]
MSKADALAAYERLPIPDVSEEHWRFTNLEGFDPDAFAGAASAEIETMLDLDVAGFATVTADGIEIERAPEGVTFAPLPEDDPRLYSLVGWDEKFAAHNAAMWKHGLLVVVPKGVVLEKPLYVRIAATGQTFWRLVVVAEEGARASLIEEYASPAADTAAYSNAVTELFVEPAAKLEYVSLQNLSQETWHFASHHARVERDAELDWVAGGFGSKKGKTRIQNDLNGEGATSRVTGAYFADGTQHLDY